MQLKLHKSCSLGQLTPRVATLPHQTHLCPHRRLHLHHRSLTIAQAAPKKNTSEEKKPQYLTPFLNNEITETLTGNEHVPEPLWSSWCGHVGGVWVGQAAAYCPTSGLAEPIALGGETGKTKLYALQQCCVEEREAAGDADVMVRRTARATTTEQLEKEMVAGGALQFDPTLSVDWEIEEITNGQEGLFIFDGGSYTAGPVFLCVDDEEESFDGTTGAYKDDDDDDDDDPPALGSRTILDTDALFRDNSIAANLSVEEDEEEEEEEGSMAELDDEFENFEDEDFEEEYIFEDEAPFPQGCTTVIEHCMQYGGEQRVRIRLTLASLLLPEGNEHNDDGGSGNAASPASAAPAGAAAQHAELDVNLLRVSICREDWEGAPGKYTASSQGKLTKKEQATSAAKRLRPKDVAGFWNVFEVIATTAADVDMRTGQPALIPLYTSREVQRLVQLPASSFEEEQGGVSGGTLWLPHSVAVQLTQGGSSSGLEVATMWSPQEGVLLGVKRRYSEEGELEEVVSSTSIRAK
jgi:ELMO domain-containing protein